MICRSCRETVLFGWRHSRPGWWHREDLDHEAFPIVETQVVVVEPLPEPEIRATPVTADSFPPRSGIRQIINLVAKTAGWEQVSLTHARGPYVGSKGTLLSTSDSTLLRARTTEVDGERRIAVASWRDGDFDFAYVGTSRAGIVYPAPANSADMKKWIKDPWPKTPPASLETPTTGSSERTADSTPTMTS